MKRSIKGYLLHFNCISTLLFVCNYSLLAGNSLRPVSWHDLAEWKYIPDGSMTLSNNGDWLVYRYRPNMGDDQVILQHTHKDIKETWMGGMEPMVGSVGIFRPMGPPAGTFNVDDSFMAFTISPAKKDRKSSSSKNNQGNKLTVVNLSTMKETSFDNVKAYTFSEAYPAYIAVQMTTPRSNESNKLNGKGTDFLLHNLNSGQSLSFGNVMSYVFNSSGEWLAWIVDTYDQKINGIQLLNLQTKEVSSLDNDQSEYKQLSWNKKENALTLIKQTKSEDFQEGLHLILAYKDLDKSIQKVIYDPRKDDNFPEAMAINPNKDVVWSEDLNSLYFGIHAITKNDADSTNKTEQTATEKPDVVIWHWNDYKLQSQQQVNELFDRSHNYLSVYHIKEQQFLRLADEQMRLVEAHPNSRFAIGYDDRPYEIEKSFIGGFMFDLYRVDAYTGKRNMIAQKLETVTHLSPNAHWIYYFYKGHYYTHNLLTDKKVNVTENIPGCFNNKRMDMNYEYAPTGSLGWTNDSKYILIADNNDVWKISADGNYFENITQNGRINQWEYQYMCGVYRSNKEEGIDLTQPLFLNATDYNTKKEGVVRIDNGQAGVTFVLPFQHKNTKDLRKAKNSDLFLYTVESSTEPPDYHLARNQDLKGAKKLTDIYPESKHFDLSPGSSLITYVNERGDTLHAALYLPAGYQKGETYPTVVYIYERLSANLNAYVRPRIPGGGWNRTIYTSNGYAVLMPDINYVLDNPGMSALECVLPALDAALETGVVDPDNVALHGHSWGAYQTCFLITQTDRFKAAVAGAALINLISMYNLIYGWTGASNHSAFEKRQARFTSGYWNQWENYKNNSPIYHAPKINTPLLLMHNDKDGAVDFTQGVEFYNTLRRLRKPVVMLQYKGEDHGLTKPANQFDYAQRMMEYLDHHLKGKEAPDWWSEGVPLLKLNKHLEARIDLLNKYHAD